MRKSGMMTLVTSLALVMICLLIPSPAQANVGSAVSLPGNQPVQAGPQQPCGIIDFGDPATPDDFGIPHVSGDVITTQYVFTYKIVFGTAVTLIPSPTVQVQTDGACVPPLRSSGVPIYTGDWTCQFKLGTAPGVPGLDAGVTSFSAEVCYIDSPGDGLPDMQAYDQNGAVIDAAFTTAGGGPSQVLTVTAPDPNNPICAVRVLSGNDPAGLSIDCLNYPEPKQKAAIPTLSEWGLIIFGVVLLAGIVWYLRRRTFSPASA